MGAAITSPPQGDGAAELVSVTGITLRVRLTGFAAGRAFHPTLLGREFSPIERLAGAADWCTPPASDRT